MNFLPSVRFPTFQDFVKRSAFPLAMLLAVLAIPAFAASDCGR